IGRRWNVSTSSAADTPASRSASPAADAENPTPGISGPTCETPLAFYDPDSRCWRTSQGTFPWALTECSPSWPTSGSMQSGIAYPRQPSVPRTSVTDSSSWPTPNVPNGGRVIPADAEWSESGLSAYRNGKKMQVGLES